MRASLTDQVSGYALGRREVISWKSQDGTTIEGVLIKPANFEAGRKYPLLCVIHGGPTGVDRPTMIDARMANNAATTDFNDAGDSFTVTFSEKMNGATTGARIEIQDQDGMPWAGHVCCDPVNYSKAKRTGPRRAVN